MTKLSFRIKICGITNMKDALDAVSLGADALGFIFAKSPRKVNKNTVKKIITKISSNITTVGVFVEQTPEKINEIMEFCGLKLVQVHGELSPQLCKKLKKPFIKVFRIGKEFDVSNLDRYKNSAGFLLDTYSKDISGGTGKAFDWEIAKKIKKHTKKPIILSGGLNPRNICKAIRAIHPDAVDICSGVEKKPGKKDKILLEKLFAQLR